VADDGHNSIAPVDRRIGDTTLMADLEIGINLWSQRTSWPDFLATARRVDGLGYRSLWTWDHLHAIFGDPLQDIFEGYMTLGAWAQATTNVELGLMVGANTFRNPGVVAKSIATLDHISNGRAVLGIGGAWFGYEHQAHGIDFGRGFGQRLDWMDESVGAMRALLDGETVTSPEGGRYAFRELRHSPPPVRRVPIMIGGTGRTKTLRTIAKYGDRWNAFGSPEEVRELDGVLREHCEAVGRDEREIRRTINLWLVIRDDPREAERAWGEAMAHNGLTFEESIEESRPILGTVEHVAQRLREYVAVGFDGVIVEVPSPFDMETLERLVGEVKPLVDAG
jgi:alkanesulfonate monooxygenase SsuD/methylene tetrahydromethanopterin reductase-like flavin-dependent oxidoreductase (luciferase family)